MTCYVDYLRWAQPPYSVAGFSPSSVAFFHLGNGAVSTSEGNMDPLGRALLTFPAIGQKRDRKRNKTRLSKQLRQKVATTRCKWIRPRKRVSTFPVNSMLPSLILDPEFYRTFWSLQLPFSKPPIFAQKDAFNEFRDGVNKALPVIKEATAKERAMMGSRVGPSTPSSLKRKREPDVEEITGGDYFFAKFLTSPDLLDLEVPSGLLSYCRYLHVARSLIHISAVNSYFNCWSFLTTWLHSRKRRRVHGPQRATVLCKWISPSNRPTFSGSRKP